MIKPDAMNSGHAGAIIDKIIVATSPDCYVLPGGDEEVMAILKPIFQQNAQMRALLE